MLNTIWMVFVAIMTIFAQTGYFMVEVGSIRTHNNSQLLLKNILVVAISSIVFFVVGFGFSHEAEGGIVGQEYFLGFEYHYDTYVSFLFHYSLCIMMASIATGPIAERTSLDTYIFFTFLNSAFIFPTILAWVWEDGWLQNLGFKDYAGAGIVHLSAGVAGFMGAYLTGPRLGKFHREISIEYMLDDENFDDKLQLNQDRMEAAKKKFHEDQSVVPVSPK